MPRDDDNGSGSLRDDIESAFDAAESESMKEAQPTGQSTEPARESKEGKTTVDPARDQTGRFATKPTAKPVEPDGAAKPVAVVGRDAAVSGVSPSAPGTAAPVPDSPTALKAPQSWKPAAREQWAGLPAEVQAETVRRERETQMALQESAEARKFHGEFRALVQPYEGMIRAEGVEPMAAIENLLRTSVALRTAPPQHKAVLVAQMVRQFGIPIEALDAALAGQAIPGGANGGQAEFRDPRVDELIAERRRERAERVQHLLNEGVQRVQCFAETHEFLEDVREDMADIMEVSARRGIVLTEEQAYDRACALNPEIAQVIQQRKAAETAATSQEATQRSRKAASSVRSSPAVSSAETQPRNLREEIEAAFEEVGGAR